MRDIRTLSRYAFDDFQTASTAPFCLGSPSADFGQPGAVIPSFRRSRSIFFAISVLDAAETFKEVTGVDNLEGIGLRCFETNPFVMVLGVALLGVEVKLLILEEPNLGGGVLEVEESPENMLLGAIPSAFAAGWLNADCEPIEPPKMPFALCGAVPNVFDSKEEDAPKITVDGFSDGFEVVSFVSGHDGAPKMPVVAAG